MIDHIKEARLLYIRKGILKREFLRNEIALSWARSYQVHNVDISKIEKNNDIRSKKIQITNEEKQKFSFIDAIIIMDKKGRTIGHYELTGNELYHRWIFLEKNIGTNGLALTFNTKKPTYVSGYEHYHEGLFDKVTFAIPHISGTNFYIIGFILSMKTQNFLTEQSSLIDFSKVIFDRLQLEKEDPRITESTTLDSFFVGYSEKMTHFKDKINQLIYIDNNVFLQGEKGSGKETVARLIHSMSPRKNEKFHSLYCDKLPTTVIVEEKMKAYRRTLEDPSRDNYGIIYCEAFETLSMKSQDVLIRLLECKPVNKNSVNTSNGSGYRFIFTSEKDMDEIRKSGLVNDKLLNRINVFTVKIPSLIEVKEDLPLLISQRIDKYVKQLFLNPIVFSELLINNLTRYSWPGNYRELDKVIEQIIHKGRHESIIDLSYLPERMNKKNTRDKRVIPLEKTEEIEIIKALEAMNYNVALTARALGIGRSTLYRKLEKYGIAI